MNNDELKFKLGIILNMTDVEKYPKKLYRNNLLCIEKWTKNILKELE